MGNHRVSVKPSAAKELEAVPKRDRQRIVRRIRGLSAEPRPVGSERLSGQERYRVRQGDCRVVYSIDDETESVVVFKVGHRRLARQVS